MKNKLTCELLLQYLSDYIDNALYEELTTEAQAHLASCNNCRVVLDTTQQTLFLFRNQGARKIPSRSAFVRAASRSVFAG